MTILKNLLASVFLFAIIAAHAQETYEWDEFGVGFELASDFEEITVTSEEWELISSDDEIFISVMPWADEEVTLDDLEEATYWVALISFSGKMQMLMGTV